MGSDVTTYTETFRNLIRRGSRGLGALSSAQSARRPAPGRWSPREIVGHLIDSASNNHQRFVRAQFQEELVFPGYDQDAWVSVQQYQEAEWTRLIELWQAFNSRLASVMDAIPEHIRSRPRRVHNLHEIAFVTVPEHVATTLDYFMEDYVHHLEHHLKQILGDPSLW